MGKWEMVRLGDIGQIVTGNTPKTSESSNFDSDDIPFFKPGDFNDGGITPLVEAENYISDNAKGKVRILPANSVLVTCIGIIGKIGITNQNATCNQQINAIIPDDENCCGRYVAYAVMNNRKHLNHIANAAVVPIVNKTQFSNLQIPLPPLPVQRQIADVLDRTSSLIEKRKTQVEKLDLLVKSQFIEMFGEGLGENATELKDICRIITDGTHQPPKFTSIGIPFLFVSNIVDNEISYKTDKYITTEDYETLIKRTPIELGDILLTTVGSYGNPAIVRSEQEFCFQRHIAYMKPKREIVNSTYLHSALLNSKVKAQIEVKVKGVAQKTLNLSELKTIWVNLPPLSLQNEFSAFVERVNEQKAQLKKSLELLDLNHKSLMQKCFSGEIF